MSELIQSWLNDEVQLSRRVTNFEDDFQNGYLFGELLSKYNQELNFHLFKDKDRRNEKINNFKLLEPTFKTLNIEFNAEIANDILHKKKGMALRTLYRLKMALEKVHNPADIKVFDETGKLNTIVPLKQIRPVREKFDKMESHLFSKRINQLNKAQKEVDLDNHLAKFEQAMVVNEMKANQKASEEHSRDRQIQDERRKIELNKLQRNITFMEDWQAKGRVEWAKNQQRKHERERKDEEFKMMTTMKMQQTAMNMQNKERDEVLQGIDAFEANAGKLGIELEHDPDQPKKVERSTFSGAGTLMKLKDASLKSETVRKERDKRRRKMIVDQAKAQRDIEIKKREEILLEKLQQQSKQENEIAYEVWRAMQCKQVIIENRALRQDKYKGKKEEQILIAQAKEDNLLRQIAEEKERDFNQKLFRQRELNIHQLSDNRLNDHKICSTFFDYIFEIADLCYQHQQDNDTLEIDPRFWRDCCNLFIEEKPLIPKKSFRHPDATDNITKAATSELTTSTQELALSELSDYLNGLGAWKPQHKFDPPKDEEDNTYIPNEPINNYKLGLIVSNIIDMKSAQRAPLVAPADIPNYLPLKLLSLGYPFSGRKTLCDFLRKQYKITVLEMNEILNEALELSNKVLKDLTPDADFNPDREEDLPEEDLPSSRKERDELAHIGLEMKTYLAQGQNIPDDLYIKAILFKIKQLYPSMTHDQFLDHLRRLKAKAESTMPESRHHTEDQELSEIQEDPEAKSVYQRLGYTEGWILMGFPNNYEQLKALEKALSGFIPNDEQEVPEAEEKKKRAEIVVKAPPKTIMPKKLVKGGVDTAIVLDVSKEECLRRALGRRLDPKTGIVYHLEDNPPPVNDAPLIERLVPIRDPENSEASLIDKLTRYDRIREDMEKWIQVFGIEEMGLNCLQKFEGVGEEEEIHAVVREHLDAVLRFKATEYERLFNEIDEAEKKKQEEQEELLRLEQEDAKMVITEQEIILEELKNFQDKRIAALTIPSELLNVMTSFWEVVQENYIGATTDVFTLIKDQRNFITVRVGEQQRRFLDLLQKEDDKLLTVLEFQKNYNKFVEENADMIEDADTKEELHQRVEDLYQQLWELIENKKEDLIEERKGIMGSGYIEDEMELLTANIQKLIQAELDRYFGCVQIIQDYYAALEGKDLPEQPENLVFDILPKGEMTLPPIEDLEGPEPYPRIDLFYKNALKILNGEELEEPGPKDPKKAGAKAPAKKEEPKKAAPGKKGQEVVQEEEKKELTPLEKELKEAVSTEKAILRYRLYLIKSLGTGRIKEMREKAKTLYTKLEDWLTYGIKAENDAVFELTKLLGEAIEGQTKVQNELQLSYVDVVKSYKHLNFLTPPPVLLPPMEVKQPNRFTISQLKSVVQQLYFLSHPTGTIDNNILLQFFTQKTASSFGKDEFPEEWRSKDFKAYQKMIKNLDPDSKGYVQIKVLCSSLCLLGTNVPKEEDVLEYQTELANNSENGLITRDNFATSNAFFDMSESAEQTETNSEHFERVYLLKDILFDINRDIERDVMDVNEFIRTITALNNSYVKTEKVENQQAQTDSPTRSPARSPGRQTKSPGRASKRMKKRVIKTYANVLFD